MDHLTLTNFLAPKGMIHIAFSGGADSVCLAHWLKNQPTLAESHQMVCWHIDHGLDADSSARAKRATALAKDLALPIQVVSVDIPSGGNIEARARDRRYEFFNQIVKAGDVLVTAHHADDVAETMLLRMLRGSGLSGLAGIQSHQPFGYGHLLRPLIQWERCEVLRYLRKFGLSWIEDPTNESMDMDRNFLRHEIMPRLKQRFGQATAAMNRSASLNREAAEILNTQIGLMVHQRAHQDYLSVSDWETLPAFTQRELIRAWSLHHGVAPPPAKPLEEFARQLSQMAPDRCPTLSWSQAVIRYYDQRLWLELASDKRQAPLTDYRLEWDGRSPLALPGQLGHLELQAEQAKPFLSSVTQTDPLLVCSGTPGEKLQLSSTRPAIRTKQLLSEARVPPWQRRCWPRIWHRGDLLALGDQWQVPSFNQALVWLNKRQSH